MNFERLVITTKTFTVKKKFVYAVYKIDILRKICRKFTQILRKCTHSVNKIDILLKVSSHGVSKVDNLYSKLCVTVGASGIVLRKILNNFTQVFFLQSII